jgi:phenylpyruvate tautomerase PptA (4-oxalocrotonate tautomerase family)
MQQTGMILIKYRFEWVRLHWDWCYFPLSNATTPSVLELNDAWQQHNKKIENFKRRRTKKYSLQSLATVTQIRRQRTLDKAKTQLPSASQCIWVLISDINSEKWFAGGFAWKWYADDYHKREKNSVDYSAGKTCTWNH